MSERQGTSCQQAARRDEVAVHELLRPRPFMRGPPLRLRASQNIRTDLGGTMKGWTPGGDGIVTLVIRIRMEGAGARDHEPGWMAHVTNVLEQVNDMFATWGASCASSRRT
jgi:hypothetical protein